MSFDSIFDKAMINANNAIERAFTSKFTLQLQNGESLDVKAFFNFQLSKDTQDNKKYDALTAENSSLTVPNQRLDKTLVIGALTETPEGIRKVISVQYPNEASTCLVLGALQKSEEVKLGENFY